MKYLRNLWKSAENAEESRSDNVFSSEDLETGITRSQSSSGSPRYIKKSQRFRSTSRPSSAIGYRAGEKKRLGSAPYEMMSEEESTTDKRLSRRSSVLVDLIALFRRSSSVGLPGLPGLPGTGSKRPSHQVQLADHEGDTTDDVEEYEESPEMMSKERILAIIRENKEIIGRVRLQPWPMRRKLRTLRAAMKQKQRHEAHVSRWNLYKVELQRRSRQFWRWLTNMGIYLIPWESKIKRIESHFGSVVSSYFIFLRWVLGLNVTISAILLFFIVIPEWLADSRMNQHRFNQTKHLKVMPPKVLARADELNTVLDFGVINF